MGSLVDPSYELIDPTPDVHALFCQFDARFFDGRLAACEVKWSPRMTTCAGICCYEGRSGLCSIRLSTPLLKLRPRKDLVETLLHEMIHAFLFVTVRDRDRDGHGPQFQWHMNRINAEAGTRITIYHTFHAEVAVYKQHHWRCDGACRERRPFFGWVKRASNRAPSKNDLWWADHERSCGGKFHKVAEPQEYTEKREKAEKKKAASEEAKAKKREAKKIDGDGGSAEKPAADAKQPRIDAVFGAHGGGSRLGGKDGDVVSRIGTERGSQVLGGASGRSRLLDLFGGVTVGKENRSTDDIRVIEQPKERMTLKGGSQQDNSKDVADERDDDVVLYEPCNEGKDGNTQVDPKLPTTPSSFNEKSLFKMSAMEENLRVMKAQVDTLFDVGDDANAIAAIESIEKIESELAVLRDEHLAWEVQKDANARSDRNMEEIEERMNNKGRSSDGEVSIVRRLTQTTEMMPIEQRTFAFRSGS